MIFLFIFLIIIFSIAGIGLYSYFRVMKSPVYEPESMPLNYEITGSGQKKLVLIHGLTGSKNYWKTDLESISQTHQLLLIDLLGFGGSPKPNCTYSLSIQMAAIEKILIKEGFNDGKTIICGHSMGAIISMALLEKNPDWFSAGIFISLPFYRNADEFNKIMSSHSMMDRLTTGKYSKYLCMFHPIFMNRFFKPENLTEEVFIEAKKHHWQSYFYSLKEIILKTYLLKIVDKIKDKKVLFIHGEQDFTASFENAKILSKEFTNAQFVSFEEGDHQFFLKDAPFVWQSIQDFSNSLEVVPKILSKHY